jgi:hypothetical protein
MLSIRNCLDPQHGLRIQVSGGHVRRQMEVVEWIRRSRRLPWRVSTIGELRQTSGNFQPAVMQL